MLLQYSKKRPYVIRKIRDSEIGKKVDMKIINITLLICASRDNGNYIPISFLNDFIFCPRSIYFHQLYGRSNESIYHTTSQSEGKLAHKSAKTQ